MKISSTSEEWESIDKETKEKLLETACDGSFWMSYVDFLKYQDGLGYAIIELN